jgi:hypothetical protein
MILTKETRRGFMRRQHGSDRRRQQCIWRVQFNRSYICLHLKFCYYSNFHLHALVVLIVCRFVAYGGGQGGAELTCSCPGQTNWPAGNGGNGGGAYFGFAVSSCLAQFFARYVAVCMYFISLICIYILLSG